MLASGSPLKAPLHRSTLKDYVARTNHLGIKNFIAGIGQSSAGLARQCKDGLFDFRIAMLVCFKVLVGRSDIVH